MQGDLSLHWAHMSTGTVSHVHFYFYIAELPSCDDHNRTLQAATKCGVHIPTFAQDLKDYTCG